MREDESTGYILYDDGTPVLDRCGKPSVWVMVVGREGEIHARCQSCLDWFNRPRHVNRDISLDHLWECKRPPWLKKRGKNE